MAENVGIPVEVRRVKDSERGRKCMARHESTPPIAEYTVNLGVGRQLIYLCEAHFNELIVETAIGIEL
jgi:hypothetical protein